MKTQYGCRFDLFYFTPKRQQQPAETWYGPSTVMFTFAAVISPGKSHAYKEDNQPDKASDPILQFKEWRCKSDQGQLHERPKQNRQGERPLLLLPLIGFPNFGRSRSGTGSSALRLAFRGLCLPVLLKPVSGNEEQLESLQWKQQHR